MQTIPALFIGQKLVPTGTVLQIMIVQAYILPCNIVMLIDTGQQY